MAKKNKSKVNKKIIKKTRSKATLFAIRVLTAFLIIISLCVLALGAVNLSYAKTVFPRVVVGGVAMAGKTQVEATTEVETLAKVRLDTPIVITADGKSATIKPREVDLKIDSVATAKKAFVFGRDENILISLGSQLSAIIKGVDLKSVATVDEDKLASEVERASKEFGQGAVDAGIKIKGTTITEIPESSGRGLDKVILAKKVSQQIFSLAKSETIEMTVTDVDPRVFTEGLTRAKTEAETIMSAPVALKYEGKDYKIDADKIGSWIIFAAGKEKPLEGRGVLLEAELNDGKVKSYVDGLAKEVDRPAINARLTIVDGKATVFSASQTGISVDKDALAKLIKDKLVAPAPREIKIPVKVAEPEISDGQIEKYGIKESIGVATTSFAKSPDNRVHNISTGANFLNGQLIRPGDTFSTIGALGKIDGSTGYLPELVIKENKTQPEFGGGLCQVSTTLFRSALNAGLPIVERSNHSWRISYYEPPVGLDATIYMPKPDLKIKNDTPGWILIQNKVDVDAKKITFELFGTKDGRTSKIIGPTLLYSTPAPDNVYTDDPGLPAGEEKRIQAPHPGGKATATYQVFDKTGKKTSEQTFVSIYKAAAAQYTRGTGPAPAPADQPPA